MVAGSADAHERKPTAAGSGDAHERRPNADANPRGASKGSGVKRGEPRGAPERYSMCEPHAARSPYPQPESATGLWVLCPVVQVNERR
jgi:hypothetical protein